MCAPDKITISCKLKPRDPKLSDNCWTLKFAPGRRPVTEDAVETLPSSLPNGTSQLGPPRKTTTSLAANERISAQETTPGHIASTAFLAAIIALKAFWGRLALSGASRSASFPEVELSKMEASHPSTKQSWSISLNVEGGTTLSFFERETMVLVTVDTAFGQEVA